MEVIHTDRAPKAIGPYSQAVYDPDTRTLYCSGQIGLDPKSGEMVPGGVEEQCKQVLENVRGVLSARGMGPEHVLKTTLYLADMADFLKVNEIYAGFFSPPYPARSTVAAAGLPKGALVELEVLARQPLDRID
ncbi:MAG: RidA family protein [Candidatus Eisenbacteria bacterium]